MVGNNIADIAIILKTLPTKELVKKLADKVRTSLRGKSRRHRCVFL